MQEYLTAPYARAFFNKKTLIMGTGSIQKKVYDLQQQDIILKLLSFFQKPASTNEAIIYISTYYSKITAEPILDMLIADKWIIAAKAYVRNARYSRPALYYELSGADSSTVQDKLSKKHVAILGCGGIGSIVAINLVTAGIGEISLIDNDDIEESNLTRQFLFTNADIGKHKTKVLKERLQERALYTKINTYDILIKDENSSKLIPRSDLMVVSGDSYGIVNHVNKYAYKNLVPFICAGYLEDIAAVGPLVVPGKARCIECFDKIYAADNVPPNPSLERLIATINNNYQAPSNGPLNMLAASLASLDIIKFLGEFGCPYSLNQRFGLWTHNLEIESQKNKYEGPCSICNF